MSLKIENNLIYWNSDLPLPDNLEEEINQLLPNKWIFNEFGIVFSNPLFNHPINNLPNWISKIYFTNHKSSSKLYDGNDWYSKFNLPLEYLPSNLHTLELNLFNYDHNLDYLPSNLQNLKLNIARLESGNDLLKNLPSKLKTLEIITKRCNWNLRNLPNFLKTLKITCHNMEADLRNLPVGLENIVIKPEICHMSQQFDLFNYLYTRQKRIKNLQLGCFNFFHN